MHNIALILAGGSGTRFNKTKPKQYFKIAGKTILEHSVAKFANLVDEIFVVVANDDDHVKQLEFPKNTTILKCGSDTRKASTKNALNIIGKKSEDYNILIHDACRPFVSPKLIQTIISELSKHKAVIPVVSIKDSLKKIDNEYYIAENLNRELYKLSQTPQGFHLNPIIDAHNNVEADNHTDDAAIATEYGIETVTVEGDYRNIKITDQSDIMFMEYEYRTGLGVDIHEFCEGNHIFLGGIKIDTDYGVKAHSDGDVVLHSLCDAILGAIGEGDIGTLFPDSDNKWKNARSEIFIQHIFSMLQEKLAQIINVDITVMTEVPRIGTYRTDIKNNLAKLLQIPSSRISIKATTTEKLGFIGRKEGIACLSNIIIKLPIIYAEEY